MEYSTTAPFKVIGEKNSKKFILPSGYRFSPLDGELVVHYLKKKILNQELPANIITTIDVYTYEATDQLPLSKCGEFKYGLKNEWFFFTTRQPHNLFPSNGGCWKEMTDEEVLEDDEVVGFKRRLDFNFAEPPQEMKADWHVHEYRVNSAIFAPSELLDDAIKEKISNFVVCIVCYKEKDPSMTSSHGSTDLDEGKEREVENKESSVHRKQ